MKKDLVKLIQENPNAVAVIDNDCWWLYADAPDGCAEEPEILAQNGGVIELGDGGYGSGECYGGDILQALAVIVGLKVESV